ncbi:MAG: ATP-binding cassette domain-containing protein [Saprospiraceae bacterium]|nr:ATP-binding cassette domain-containing protein [Saprospiraceae bacterium]
MTVRLQNISKRYRRWVIKDCTLDLVGPNRIGISGTNGSGKSTLLKIISGYLSPSQGKVSYWADDQQLDKDSIYRNMSFYAPYGQGIEELTLKEHYMFHQQFKAMPGFKSADSFFAEIQLAGAQEEYLKNLSSGMAQRFLLGLTFLSEGLLYLFDEPCSFLDRAGKEWFEYMLDQHLSNKLAIVASNQPEVLALCRQSIDVKDFC